MLTHRQDIYRFVMTNDIAGGPGKAEEAFRDPLSLPHGFVDVEAGEIAHYTEEEEE